MFLIWQEAILGSEEMVKDGSSCKEYEFRSQSTTAVWLTGQDILVGQ